MKASEVDRQTVAVFEGAGQVRLVDEPVPTPQHGEVLVRNRACALCTMERRVFDGSFGAYPIVPGHEVAGEVAAVGPGVVLDVAPGDKVALAVMDRCMQCEACRRGQSQLCTGKQRGRAPGELRRLGGLGRFVAVPAHKVYPMPAHLSFEHIALVEPLACVVHSLRRADIRLGDDVLVIGGGTMGHLHALVARLLGARVSVCEPDPRKRALALEHGAHHACAPAELEALARSLTSGRGVEHVFVTFGSAATAAQAYDAVAPGGSVIFYSSFPKDAALPVSPHTLHKQEIVLDGAANQRVEDWQEATRLLARGLLDLSHMVSATYPLERVAEAMAEATLARDFRVVVTL